MTNRPYTILFISIISVSFAAIFIKLSEAPALSIAFYRLFFTTILLLPLVIFSKNIRLELLHLPRSTIALMIGIGLILAAHFSLWITSISMTSIASSVILVTAHPILVGPISHFFFKERLSYLNTIGIFLSVGGVIILVLGNFTQEKMTLQGNLLALLGGIAAGLYILGGRKMRKTVSVTSYAVVVYGVCAIALCALCLLFNAPLYHLRTTDYELIFLMALISGIFGHTLYNYVLKHIRASVASVALLGEPFGSTLLAIAIPQIHQIPSIYTLLGGVVILLGVYFTAKNTMKPDLLETF